MPGAPGAGIERRAPILALVRSLLLAVALALVAAAPAAAAVERPSDQTAIPVWEVEESLQAFCDAELAAQREHPGEIEKRWRGLCFPPRPTLGNAALPPDAPALVLRPEQGRWIVDWLKTFTRANVLLGAAQLTAALPHQLGEPDLPPEIPADHDLAMRILDSGLVYAATHPRVGRRFQQYHPPDPANCSGGAPDCPPASGSWVSAITHSAALRAYSRAAADLMRRGHAERAGPYLGMVETTLAVFRTDTGSGGVRTQGMKDHHYALYSFNPHSLVFNNFAQSVWAFWEAAQIPLRLAPVAGLPQDHAWHDLGMDADLLYREGIPELAAEGRLTGRCRHLAYNVLRTGEGRRARYAPGVVENPEHRDTTLAALDGMLAGRGSWWHVGAADVRTIRAVKQIVKKGRIKKEHRGPAC